MTSAPDSADFGEPRWEGDTRPPLLPGHTLTVKSGAWSPRFITAEMEELRPRVQAVIAECPWVRPVDEFALLDFVRDMARAELLERWLHDHGDRYPATDKARDGELRDRDLRELGALRNRLLTHRARLGLDPASRLRMASSSDSDGLDALKAAGRELREAAEHRALSPAAPEAEHSDDEAEHADEQGSDDHDS